MKKREIAKRIDELTGYVYILVRELAPVPPPTYAAGETGFCGVLSPTGTPCSLIADHIGEHATVSTGEVWPLGLYDPNVFASCGAGAPLDVLPPGTKDANRERCGLLRGHTGQHMSWPSGARWPIPPAPDSSTCECERWREGADVCPLHNVFKETCDAVAVGCLYHDPAEPGDCPRTPHDHPACTYRRGHATESNDGHHSWNLYGTDNRPSTDPHAPKPVTYEIPPAPPVGRSVIDRDGERWTRRPDGGWASDSGFYSLWSRLLNECGPVTLAELTDEERASEALYGPVGMRWANPDGPPCPYVELSGTSDPETPELHPCTLRTGHGGPHLGDHGEVLGADSTVDGPIAVTPQQSADSGLCTCGRPDQHQPGCPRYARMAHISPLARPAAADPYNEDDE